MSPLNTSLQRSPIKHFEDLGQTLYLWDRGDEVGHWKHSRVCDK